MIERAKEQSDIEHGILEGEIAGITCARLDASGTSHVHVALYGIDQVHAVAGIHEGSRVNPRTSADVGDPPLRGEGANQFLCTTELEWSLRRPRGEPGSLVEYLAVVRLDTLVDVSLIW